MLLVVFFAIAPAMAQTHTPRYVSMAARTKGFYEYLPEGYNPSGTTTYPLLLFITGIGEFGSGSTTDLPKVLKWGPPKLIQASTFPKSFTVNGQTHRFIVITPQFVTSPRPTAADIEAVLNYIVAHYKVNTRRIYITGLSYGGGVTWSYPGDNAGYAQRAAAVVPVAGAAPSGGDSTIKARSRTIAVNNVPVWAFHNLNDPSVPVATANSYITYINQPPAPTPPARKTIFNVSGHDAWTKAYDPAYKENNLNVYQWMLQYQRSTPNAKIIQVNVYGGTNPFNNTAWNNWNVGTTAATNKTFSALKYSNGTTSAVSATLSATTGVADNGSTYASGGAMAPPEAMRYTSSSTALRTLTLKGLSTTKKYTLEFYASRSSSTAGNTVFTINGVSKTIGVYNNMATEAKFINIAPNSSGQIVVSINKSSSYNYLNGFSIVEFTGVTATGSAAFDPALALSEPEAPGIGVMHVAPNPASGSTLLTLNSPYTGTVQVQLSDANGTVHKSFRLVKSNAVLQQPLSIHDLPNGVYFMTVQMGAQRQTARISKL
jgi:dienelactone hydrolase